MITVKFVFFSPEVDENNESGDILAISCCYRVRLRKSRSNKSSLNSSIKSLQNVMEYFSRNDATYKL